MTAYLYRYPSHSNSFKMVIRTGGKDAELLLLTQEIENTNRKVLDFRKRFKRLLTRRIND